MTHSVDKHVGQAVRAARQLSGLSQSELGDAIGVKFQQVQKYETGVNRISSSKLWDISQRLGVPISMFFPMSEGKRKGADFVDISLKDARLISSILRLPEGQRVAIAELVEALVPQSK